MIVYCVLLDDFAGLLILGLFEWLPSAIWVFLYRWWFCVFAAYLISG